MKHPLNYLHFRHIYNYMIRRYQDEVTQKSLKNYHAMPFSSLVHMHTNHYLLKITELEYSQCACVEAKQGELALRSIHH